MPNGSMMVWVMQAMKRTIKSKIMNRIRKIFKKNRSLIVAIFLCGLLVSACGDNKWKAKSPGDAETMNSGKLSVVCDESVKIVLEDGFKFYQKDYPKVELSVKYANARKTMAELLGGRERVIVTARDYLPDEDSLMLEFGVEKHEKQKVAIDAMVFVVNKNFPIDTMNANDLFEIFTSKKKFKNYYPTLKSNPKIYIRGQNNSENNNFTNLVCKNKKLTKKLNILNDNDSLINIVKNNKNSISVMYLSSVVKRDDVKMLMIGFENEDGKYINPKPVHQGYIVQDLYPYRVNIWVYLLENRRNLPYWFASYLAKENKVQENFIKLGIVPAFAKVKLVPQ
jgi:ABC-type phosphate transport system substrate-binding protein